MTATIQLYASSQYFESVPEMPKDSHISCDSFAQELSHDLSLAELTSLLEQSTADYVGFLDFPVPDHTFLNQLSTMELNADQPGIGLLPFCSADLFVQAWETLPAVAAALAMNPFEHAMVFLRKTDLLQVQNLTDSNDLLWQAFIQLIQNGVPPLLADSRSSLSGYSGFPRILPELAPDEPGTKHNWLYSELSAYDPFKDLPSIASRPDATAVKAGLLCIRDYLDESHQFSQSVQHEGRHRAGDYWHHIMHRREPDYSNAKYWSRAVGSHPLQDDLPAAVQSVFDQFQSSPVENWKARLVSGGQWSLNAFVDCCAECATSGDQELNKFAKQIQWIEMQLLLQRTSLDATTV